MTDNTDTVDRTEPPTASKNPPQLDEVTTCEESTTANMTPAKKIKWLATYAQNHGLLNPSAKGNLLFPGERDGWTQEGSTTPARWTYYSRDTRKFTHPEFYTTSYRKGSQKLDTAKNKDLWFCRLTMSMGDITAITDQTTGRAYQCVIQASSGAESLLYAEIPRQLRAGTMQILHRDDTTPALWELSLEIPSLIEGNTRPVDLLALIAYSQLSQDD